MSWDDKDIKDTYMNIIRDSKNYNKKFLDDKYKDFIENFPRLYQNAIESSFSGEIQQSLEKLNIFLKIKKNIKDGKTSSTVGSAMASNHLAKEYIYPKTGAPSNEDYKKAFDKLSKKSENDN